MNFYGEAFFLNRRQRGAFSSVIILSRPSLPSHVLSLHLTALELISRPLGWEDARKSREKHRRARAERRVAPLRCFSLLFHGIFLSFGESTPRWTLFHASSKNHRCFILSFHAKTRLGKSPRARGLFSLRARVGKEAEGLRRCGKGV